MYNTLLCIFKEKNIEKIKQLIQLQNLKLNIDKNTKINECLRRIKISVGNAWKFKLVVNSLLPSCLKQKSTIPHMKRRNSSLKLRKRVRIMLKFLFWD